MHTWRVEYLHGDAGAFHAADPAGDRSATFHTVAHPTLVLGSTQTEAAVDADEARALGVEVVRRRSGGGAVLLLPGEFVWLDLVIPADDPLWSADVGAAMLWVGELWQRALASLGETAGSVVHHGPLIPSPWSKAVCWAGVGTGELLAGPSAVAANVAPSKLVGISQRRTRSWARFQSMCHLQWRPDQVTALVAPPRPPAAELAGLAATVDASATAITAALIGMLSR